jgi:hypothetical protein
VVIHLAAAIAVKVFLNGAVGIIGKLAADLCYVLVPAKKSAELSSFSRKTNDPPPKK